MSVEKPILIAAATLDSHAYEPVCEALEARGRSAVVYRTDQVLSGEAGLSVGVHTDGRFTMSYDNQSIHPEDIGAAWYRKVANFEIPHAGNDRARQLYIHNEIRHYHNNLWSLYPADIWLNSPENMRKTDTKLGQLVAAHEAGFSIPETRSTNTWEDVRELLTIHDQVIVKVIRGIVSDHEKLKALYTTVLDESAILDLENRSTPFPGIYQPFIAKAREWRVTIVGDDIFSAAIYTDETAKDDWRLHQLTRAVDFRDETLPGSESEKCFRFLGRTGLRFGAFDLVEKPDGEIIFLECNPNGQYGWLEESLGFPISASIANELIKIAASR